MKKDSDLNIFQTAAQQASKKAKPAAAVKKTATPKPPPPPPPPPPPTANMDEIPTGDANEMLKMMRDKYQELQGKLEDVLNRTGINPNRLEDMVATIGQGNPLWEQAQKEKSKLEEKIRAIVGTAPKSQYKERKVVKADKARKSKTLGSRKNWIQMR